MKTYLEPSEVELLEANAVTFDRPTQEWVPCLRDQLLIRFLFRLACRVSEALGIGMEDVDLENRMVRILHLKERLRLYCPECGVRLARSARFCSGCGRAVTAAEKRIQESRRQRILPLDEQTFKLLQHYIDLDGPIMKDGRLVLFEISRNTAWRMVTLAAQRAGLGQLTNPETGRKHNVSPHRLRDAFATHAATVDGSTESMRLLQEHMGHQNIGTTMRYRKVAGQELKDWHKRLWERDEADG